MCQLETTPNPRLNLLLQRTSLGQLAQPEWGVWVGQSHFPCEFPVWTSGCEEECPCYRKHTKVFEDGGASGQQLTCR